MREWRNWQTRKTSDLVAEGRRGLRHFSRIFLPQNPLKTCNNPHKHRLFFIFLKSNRGKPCPIGEEESVSDVPEKEVRKGWCRAGDSNSRGRESASSWLVRLPVPPAQRKAMLPRGQRKRVFAGRNAAAGTASFRASIGKCAWRARCRARTYGSDFPAGINHEGYLTSAAVL